MMQYLKVFQDRLLGSAELSCAKTQELMSAFIDSMTTAEEAALVESHTATCSACQRQLQAFVSVRNLMSTVEEPPLPPDLVLETRLRLSRERSGRSLRRLGTRLDNFFRPLAVPAGVGMAATILFFGALLGQLQTASALAITYDRPTPIYQAARVDDPTVTRLSNGSLGMDEPLIIEAFVDLRGRVIDYEVLSGSSGPEQDRWLKETMFYAEFRPARVFGEPIESHVILSFVGITVV